jgi:hypothetical protein
MKIRLSLLVLAAAVVTVAGALLVTPASGGSSVPFHASFQYTLTPAANPAPCVDATRYDVVGSGIATHLGRFDTVQYECSQNGDPLAFTGRYTFTGANGDTISGAYAGRFVPIPGSNELRPDAHWTIDGGTGRFTGATGGGPVSGHGTLAGGVVILDGTITSVGSLKH